MLDGQLVYESEFPRLDREIKEPSPPGLFKSMRLSEFTQRMSLPSEEKKPKDWILRHARFREKKDVAVSAKETKKVEEKNQESQCSWKNEFQKGGMMLLLGKHLNGELALDVGLMLTPPASVD